MSDQAPKLSFHELRARNVVENQQLLGALSQLRAAASSQPAPARRASAPRYAAPAVGTRASTRIAALPRSSLAERDLAPPILFQRVAATGKNKTKSKKGKDEGDGEDEEGSGDGGGVTKSGRKVYIEERKEFGLTSVTVSEEDLAAIREGYSLIRLRTFKVDGVWPATFNPANRKGVRITNGEFTRLNQCRAEAHLPVIKRKLDNDPVWVKASVAASANYEIHLDKAVLKATTVQAVQAARLAAAAESDEDDEDEEDDDNDDDDDEDDE